MPGLSTVNTGETREISAIPELSCYYFKLIIYKFNLNYKFTCIFVDMKIIDRWDPLICQFYIFELDLRKHANL